MRFIVILFLEILITNVVSAVNESPIYFADKQLEETICKALDTNLPITRNKILELINLETLGVRIHKIEGIENAVNLRRLVLMSKGITDISVLSNLVNLEELDLAENRIVDLSPLQTLVNLKRLYLDNNQIRDISPIAELSHLQKLTLTLNPLNEEAYSIYIPQIRRNNPNITIYHDRGLTPAKSLYLAQRLFFPCIGALIVVFYVLVFLHRRKSSRLSKR